MMYPPNSPCIICHSQGDQWKLAKLRQMEQLCSGLEGTDSVRHNLNTGLRVHSGCRYGLSCSKLSSFDNECNAVVRSIANKLVTVAVSSDDAIYNQILELCRGDFPGAYRELERIHHSRNAE